VTDWALVAVGAAVGAPARWFVDQAVSRRHASALPWGTFTVNTGGSFLLGLLLGLADAGAVGPAAVVLLGTGFCGAFTTVSTWAYESVALAEEGSGPLAVLTVVGGVLVGVLVAVAGWALGAAG
jgi:CrcB protein